MTKKKTEAEEPMTAGDLIQDEHNYRKHSETNKKRIRKSIDEAGLGRSVVVDADGVIIAGNGVQSVVDPDTPVRVIETDGTELVVVKRTDLHEGDERRKILAAADNATADNVEWDFGALEADGWDADMLQDWVFQEEHDEDEKQEINPEDLGIEPIAEKGKSVSGKTSMTFIFSIEDAYIINAWINQNSKEELQEKIVGICRDVEAK